MIEFLFLFCLIWSICASVDEDSRRKIDNYLRELEGQFPAKVSFQGVKEKVFLRYMLVNSETQSFAQLSFRILYLSTLLISNRRHGHHGKTICAQDGNTPHRNNIFILLLPLYIFYFHLLTPKLFQVEVAFVTLIHRIYPKQYLTFVICFNYYTVYFKMMYLNDIL